MMMGLGSLSVLLGVLALCWCHPVAAGVEIWQPGEQSSAMTGCLAHDYLFCIFTHLSVISVFILFFSPTRMLLECVNASGGTAFAGTLVSTIWDPDGEEQSALGVGGMVFMHYLS